MENVNLYWIVELKYIYRLSLKVNISVLIWIDFLLVLLCVLSINKIVFVN